MEERNLEYFWKNYRENKLCKPYAFKFRRCKTKKDFIDLSLLFGAILIFADSVYKGYGVSLDYLKKEFCDYMNGKYIGLDINKIPNFKDIKHEFYCGYENELKINSHVIHLCNCKCDVIQTIETCGFIYITNSSDIKIKFNEYSRPIICIMDDSKITVVSDTKNCNIQIFKFSDECIINTENANGNYIIKREEIII